MVPTTNSRTRKAAGFFLRKGKGEEGSPLKHSLFRGRREGEALRGEAKGKSLSLSMADTVSLPSLLSMIGYTALSYFFYTFSCDQVHTSTVRLLFF